MRLILLDALKFGIPQIDNDHERIVLMMNEINDCLSGGDFDSALRQVIHLIAVERKHVGFENRLLKKYAYRGILEHSRHHQEINDQLSMLMEALGDGDHEKAKRLHEGLAKNFLEDVMVADLPFKSLLQDRVLGR